VKTERLEARSGNQGWVQIAIYIAVLFGSLVAGAAAANAQIGFLERRQDVSDTLRLQDHDVLLKLKQQSDDMHEWLKPVTNPWEKN